MPQPRAQDRRLDPADKGRPESPVLLGRQFAHPGGAQLVGHVGDGPGGLVRPEPLGEAGPGVEGAAGRGGV